MPITRTCQVCGKEFRVFPSIIERGFGIFCSRFCYQKYPRPVDHTKVAVRFWKKVDRSAGPDACWPWLSAITRGGYGLFTISTGNQIYAHRMAYQLTKGPIPDLLLATHECDNRVCCNPSHIIPGTARKNALDFMKRNQHLRRKHFLPVQVIDIRYSGETVTFLSEKYGCVPSTIYRIRSLQTYSFVG
jgi:hypothetical protein